MALGLLPLVGVVATMAACGRSGLYPGFSGRPEQSGGTPGAGGTSGTGGTVGTGGTGGATCGPTIELADPVIEERVRAAIGKPSGALLPRDVEPLHSLSVRGEGIIDLRGVECLTALASLDLGDNDVLEIQPLAALTRLRTLLLDGNDIDDLTAVSPLRQLEVLDVSRNEIASLEALAPLTHLRELTAAGNAVRDLRPLSGMTQLTSLDLGGNGLFDISPLAALPQLARLTLAGARLDDLAPLAALGRLRSLDLTGSAGPLLLDVAPLGALADLEELRLGDVFVRSLAPLRALHKLRILKLFGSFIDHPSPLTELAPLVELSVTLGRYDRSQELLPLPPTLHRLEIAGEGTTLDVRTLTALETLTAYGCDIVGLETLTHLRTLLYTGAYKLALPITSLVGHANLQSLQVSLLGARYTAADMAALATLTGLQELSLSSVEAGIDLTPLAALSALRVLEVGACPSHLPRLPDLRTLRTPMPTNLAELRALTGLTELDLSPCPGGPTTIGPELDSLRSLEVLHVDSVRSIPLVLDDARRLAELPNLRELALGATPAHWDELTELGQIRSLIVAAAPSLPRMPRLHALTVAMPAPDGTTGPPPPDPSGWPDLPRLRSIVTTGLGLEASTVAAMARFDLTELQFYTRGTSPPGPMPHLRRLTFETAAARIDGSDLSSSLPELQHLSLPSGSGAIVLSGHPRLRSLVDAGGTHAVTFTSGEIAFPNLLTLAFVSFSAFRDVALPSLRLLQGFYSGDGSFDFATVPGVEALRLIGPASVHLPVLAELRVLDGYAGDDLQLPNMPHLQQLLLNYANGGLTAARITFGELPALRLLWLAPAYFGASLESHDFLASLPAVEDLSLDDPALQDLGVLASLPRPERLRRLQLVTFDDSGRLDFIDSSLEALARFSAVEELELPAPHLDVAKMPPLPSLTTLTLNPSPATFVDLPPLAGLRSLSLTVRADIGVDLSALANYTDLGDRDTFVVTPSYFDCVSALADQLRARGVVLFNCL